MRKSASSSQRSVNGLMWDQDLPKGNNDNFFLNIEEAGGKQELLGVSPRASTNASSRGLFKHCCSMQIPPTLPHASSDAHLCLDSIRSVPRSQLLANKEVGTIVISRRSSNSMRADVVSHSFNNIIKD